MGRPFAEGARLALTGVPNAIQDACRGVTAVEDVPSFKLPLMSSPAQSAHVILPSQRAQETDDLMNRAGIRDAGKPGEIQPAAPAFELSAAQGETIGDMPEHLARIVLELACAGRRL